MRTIPSANYRSLGTYLYLYAGLINLDAYQENVGKINNRRIRSIKKLRHELVIANGIHCVDTMKILSYDRKATSELR